MTTLGSDQIQQTIKFHGHWCPGLATGLRAAELGLQFVGHASDEDVVAVCETDMCGVDAISVIMGCTVGKGNLIIVNYGKVAFNFYRRGGTSVRVCQIPREPGSEEFRYLQTKLNRGCATERDKTRLQELRDEKCRMIMEGPIEALFSVGTPILPLPPHAPMYPSVICEMCGEKVMESEARLRGGNIYCKPCVKSF